MCDNFDSDANSNFTGMLLTANAIACGGRCHFGLQLGPHPWYAEMLGNSTNDMLQYMQGWVGGWVGYGVGAYRAET